MAHVMLYKVGVHTVMYVSRQVLTKSTQHLYSSVVIFVVSKPLYC